MTIDFSAVDKVMITMYDFVKILIDKLPPKLMIGTKSTAAPEYLFKTSGPLTPASNNQYSVRVVSYTHCNNSILRLESQSRFTISSVFPLQ